MKFEIKGAASRVLIFEDVAKDAVQIYFEDRLNNPEPQLIGTFTKSDFKRLARSF